MCLFEKKPAEIDSNFVCLATRDSNVLCEFANPFRIFKSAATWLQIFLRICDSVASRSQLGYKFFM